MDYDDELDEAVAELKEAAMVEFNTCHGAHDGKFCSGGSKGGAKSYRAQQAEEFRARQATQYGGKAKTLATPDLSWTKAVRQNFADKMKSSPSYGPTGKFASGGKFTPGGPPVKRTGGKFTQKKRWR